MAHGPKARGGADDDSVNVFQLGHVGLGDVFEGVFALFCPGFGQNFFGDGLWDLGEGDEEKVGGKVGRKAEKEPKLSLVTIFE